MWGDGCEDSGGLSEGDKFEKKEEYPHLTSP